MDAARDRVAKVTTQAPKLTLCYEAGYDGFWLARFLEQRDIECLVMEPASLQVNRCRRLICRPWRARSSSVNLRWPSGVPYI